MNNGGLFTTEVEVNFKPLDNYLSNRISSNNSNSKIQKVIIN